MSGNRPEVQTFGYYGGKQSRLGFILPLLAETRTYVEPFFGTGAIYLNKRPRSEINIVNDLDDNIVNMFRQIRDNGRKLRDMVHNTPYARSEFQRCIGMDAENDLERARQTLVTIIGCFRHSTHATDGVWRRSGKTNVEQYLRATETRIETIMDELRWAQIECKPALSLVEAMGGVDDCLIYMDPPYVLGARTPGQAYHHEMSDGDHEALLTAACAATCKVAISGYRNEIYDRTLKGWHAFERSVRSPVAVKRGINNRKRNEVVWTNYKPPHQGALI